MENGPFPTLFPYSAEHMREATEVPIFHKQLLSIFGGLNSSVCRNPQIPQFFMFQTGECL